GPLRAPQLPQAQRERGRNVGRATGVARRPGPDDLVAQPGERVMVKRLAHDCSRHSWSNEHERYLLGRVSLVEYDDDREPPGAPVGSGREHRYPGPQPRIGFGQRPVVTIVKEV